MPRKRKNVLLLMYFSSKISPCPHYISDWRMQGRCRSCKSATPVETWHAAAAAAVSRRRAFTLAGLGTTTHGGRSATATRAHTAQSGHSTCFLIDCAPAPVPAPAPLREEHPAGELSTIPALASWSLRCQHTVIQVKNI